MPIVKREKSFVVFLKHLRFNTDEAKTVKASPTFE